MRIDPLRPPLGPLLTPFLRPPDTLLTPRCSQRGGAGGGDAAADVHVRVHLLLPLQACQVQVLLPHCAQLGRLQPPPQRWVLLRTPPTNGLTKVPIGGTRGTGGLLGSSCCSNT
eukprot:1186606-Prorocentrum_minimum.AAC.2